MLGFGRVYARPGAGPDGRSPRAPPAQRAGPHLRAVPRVAAGARHHAVGRRRRHAGEHVTIRRGQAHGTDGGAPPLRFAAAAGPSVRVLHGLPDRAHAGGRGRRAGLGAAGLSHAADAGRRGDRGRVSGHPPREHPRVDAARQESRASPRTAVGGVGEGRRPPRRGRLEGAVRPCRLHRLRDLCAHIPRRQLDGRRRHARVPLRRLRGDGRSHAGGQPLRRPRRAQHDGAVLAIVRAAGGRRGPGHAARSRRARLRASA